MSLQAQAAFSPAKVPGQISPPISPPPAQFLPGQASHGHYRLHYLCPCRTGAHPFELRLLPNPPRKVLLEFGQELSAAKDQSPHQLVPRTGLQPLTHRFLNIQNEEI